jgi:hypothetical protein
MAVKPKGRSAPKAMPRRGSAPAGMSASDGRSLSCGPKDVTARILKSPNPNDIASDWSGESRIGLSWSFIVKRLLKTEGGTFLQGDLISPRGGITDRNVFVLESEWSCIRQ